MVACLARWCGGKIVWWHAWQDGDVARWCGGMLGKMVWCHAWQDGEGGRGSRGGGATVARLCGGQMVMWQDGVVACLARWCGGMLGKMVWRHA